MARPGQVEATVAGRASRQELRRNVAIVACFFTVYVTFAPQIMRSLNPLTGDEPFYVMTALSIARDRDLDESNNYAQRDYESFYPPDPLPAGWRGWPAIVRPLPPHPAHSVRPGLYSKHGLGDAVLILLPYALGGRDAVVALLNLVAARLSVGSLLMPARVTSPVRLPPKSWVGKVVWRSANRNLFTSSSTVM